MQSETRFHVTLFSKSGSKKDPLRLGELDGEQSGFSGVENSRINEQKACASNRDPTNGVPIEIDCELIVTKLNELPRTVTMR